VLSVELGRPDHPQRKVVDVAQEITRPVPPMETIGKNHTSSTSGRAVLDVNVTRTWPKSRSRPGPPSSNALQHRYLLLLPGGFRLGLLSGYRLSDHGWNPWSPRLLDARPSGIWSVPECRDRRPIMHNLYFTLRSKTNFFVIPLTTKHSPISFIEQALFASTTIRGWNWFVFRRSKEQHRWENWNQIENATSAYRNGPVRIRSSS